MFMLIADFGEVAGVEQDIGFGEWIAVGVGGGLWGVWGAGVSV